MRVRTALTAAVSVVLSTVTGMVVTAATADAVPGVSFVSGTSAFNSSSPKVITADCPPGSVVLGGTAEVNGAEGQVLIQSAFPMWNAGALKHQFVVKVEEDFTGTDKAWEVTAGAYCTPGIAVQYVSASSALNSDPIKNVPVECPEGMKVVGMGGQVSVGIHSPNPDVEDLPDGRVIFNGMQVNKDLNKVTARAVEEDAGLGGNFGGSWAVAAVAACAHEFDVYGVEYRSAKNITGLLPTDSHSEVDFDCTAGKSVVSMGSVVDDYEWGQWYLDRFSRYNAFQQRMIGEADRNGELGSAHTRHYGYMICF
jgi:hypothetical protein